MFCFCFELRNFYFINECKHGLIIGMDQNSSWTFRWEVPGPQNSSSFYSFLFLPSEQSQQVKANLFISKVQMNLTLKFQDENKIIMHSDAVFDLSFSFRKLLRHRSHVHHVLHQCVVPYLSTIAICWDFESSNSQACRIMT